MTVARPVKTPSWATDTNYPAGADPWSATPTRVEPSSGDKAEGSVPGTRSPAQWFNFLVGYLTDWILYLSTLIDTDEQLTYQTAKAIERSCSMAGDCSSPWQGVLATDQGWRQQTVVDPEWRSLQDAAPLWIKLTTRVGDTIVGADVSVNPGTARSGANRIFGQICVSTTPDWSAGAGGTGFTPLAPAVGDDTTTNQQTIIVTLSVARVVAAGESYYLQVTGGNDASSNLDKVFAGRVRLLSPGPR